MPSSSHNRPSAWDSRATLAGFVCPSVAEFLARSPPAFLRVEVQALVRAAAGLRVCMRDEQLTDPRDRRQLFLGAVLAKLAQRGIPTPCSWALEKAVVALAEHAGLIQEVTVSEGNTETLSCTWKPHSEDFEGMLRACFFPELLLERNEIDALLELFRNACDSDREIGFLDQLLAVLPDPRLALFCMPQRGFRTLLDTQKLPAFSDYRVDFAIEVPRDLAQGTWSRAVIEIDDAESHDQSHKRADRRRDWALRFAGYSVTRIPLPLGGSWNPQDHGDKVQLIASWLQESAPGKLLEAASRVRAMAAPLRQALQSMVLLPLAESRLMLAIAKWVYQGRPLTIGIGDPQGLGLAPVLASINSTIKALASIHGLGSPPAVFLEHDAEKAGIIYYGMPSADAWLRASSGTTAIVLPSAAGDGCKPRLLRAEPLEPAPSNRGADELEGCLELFLHDLFRKDHFREGQVAIIRRALSRAPVVGLLPTGAGKSLCYQLPSMLQPGCTVVVCPLLSLIQDQHDNLLRAGINSSAVVSSRQQNGTSGNHPSREQILKNLEGGHYQFLLISPERMQIEGFRNVLRRIASRFCVPYSVIDEAHCVSEWGHDFRPSYLRLSRTILEQTRHQGFAPAWIALTATASPFVLVDIRRVLEVADPHAVIEPKSFDREELSFDIVKVKASERMAVLRAKLRDIVGEKLAPSRSGLVFSFFVNGDLGVSNIADTLSRHFGEPIPLYSGGKPHGRTELAEDWESHKREVQDKFKSGEHSLLVCTHGFGMGIDKPDVRYTIHVMLPWSVQDYYQQAGRAGRDRGKAQCLVLFCDDQPGIADQILDPISVSPDAIGGMARTIPKSCQGDALRSSYFICNNFPGKPRDKEVVMEVVKRLEAAEGTPHATGQIVSLPYRISASEPVAGDSPAIGRELMEKALYRLSVVGWVRDYTIDHVGGEFRVQLGDSADREPAKVRDRLRSYLTQYYTDGRKINNYLAGCEQGGDGKPVGVSAAEQLIDFIYDEIERHRREARRHMLALAREVTALKSPDERNDAIRKRLQAYLQPSEKYLQSVTSLAQELKPEKALLLWDEINAEEVHWLLGVCRRVRETFTESPNLALVEGLCLLASNQDPAGVRELRTWLRLLRLDNGVSPHDRAAYACEVANVIQRIPSKASGLEASLEAFLDADPSPHLAKLLYPITGQRGTARKLALGLIAANLVEICSALGEPRE